METYLVAIYDHPAPVVLLFGLIIFALSVIFF